MVKWNFWSWDPLDPLRNPLFSKNATRFVKKYQVYISKQTSTTMLLVTLTINFLALYLIYLIIVIPTKLISSRNMTRIEIKIIKFLKYLISNIFWSQLPITSNFWVSNIYLININKFSKKSKKYHHFYKKSDVSTCLS